MTGDRLYASIGWTPSKIPSNSLVQDLNHFLSSIRHAKNTILRGNTSRREIGLRIGEERETGEGGGRGGGWLIFRFRKFGIIVIMDVQSVLKISWEIFSNYGFEVRRSN